MKGVSVWEQDNVKLISIQMLGVVVHSVYKPPNEKFVLALGHRNLPDIVIGDFNSHSTTWGYTNTQQLPPARGGTAHRKIFNLANRSKLIHPGPSSSRSSFFMESSQLYAAMLTYYSTKPLTTGSDFDPLHLLLALAGDVT